MPEPMRCQMDTRLLPARRILSKAGMTIFSFTTYRRLHFCIPLTIFLKFDFCFTGARLYLASKPPTADAACEDASAPEGRDLGLCF